MPPDAKTASPFETVYARLRAILHAASAAGALHIATDTPGQTTVEFPASAQHPTPGMFGMVAIKKQYVSYHLMPIYHHPELLEGMSDGLRKRMQGKSCFNFKAEDEALFAELAALTQRGRARALEG